MKYFFYFAIIFSVTLMFLISKKWKREGKKMGCLSSGYIFLVIFTISVLFFPFAGILLQKINDSFTKPSYEATIVDFESYTARCKNSNGNNYNCIKYLTFVEFELIDGTKKILKTDIQGSEKPKIGNTLKILYAKGDTQVDEISWRRFVLFFGLSLLLFFMGAVLVAGLNYSLGRSNKALGNIVMTFLLYLLIPGALIGFLAVFIWILWNYFMNVEDFPVWVVIMAFVFIIFLIPSILAYLKNIFTNKKKKLKKPKSNRL